MNEPQELTAEQEFSVIKFQSEIENISLEQAKKLLVESYRQSIVQRNLYAQITKSTWGIDA